MKEQKIRILKLVEEGKLSPDEALSLIESLESEKQEKEAKLTALSTEVIDQGEHNKNEHQDTNDFKQSLGTKLMDWVDTAVKKVKEIDLDINFGKSIDLQHIFQFPGATFENIDIHVPNGSVSIQPWGENDIRVECDAKVYRVENNEQARETFLSSINCNVEGNRFICSTEKKTLKLNLLVKVPEQVYEQVKVKLFNGPIRGENLQVGNLKAKTANGVVSFSSITAKKAEFETANGQIKLANSKYEKLEAETISGIIEFDGVAERADIQSFNGNLMLSIKDHSCETLYAKTTTGNIEILLPEESRLVGDLKSNLGAVSTLLKDAETSYEKNETIQKELRFRTSKEPTLTLFADSKTGSIVVK
ncbi:DUF4097 family beta strand repeat-containing protein [Metabacillus litoralis]|uniref:DUF4097 family beta strand repeat-containing protein n=1 Tax=Metabacillus litoralis TaxID=152268 RepID=UPI001CFD2B0E|nr:DUF4097 domain-containing protein [Metabacillus litoralis]